MSELEAKRVRDRISALPDAILCHILSFLDRTEDAVKTSVLSRRWKKIWGSVPTLVFSDEDNTDNFVRLVDNVLFFRDSIDIQKFEYRSLCVDDFDRIYGWIGAAIRRNVVELDLSIQNYGDDDQLRVFELPDIVFTCKTLMVLTLSSNFITNPPASGCFPSLKSLDVQIGHPVNKSVENVLTCCPVLESLRIGGDHGRHGDDPILNFNVSAPKLKMLRIFWSSYDVYEKCCKFHINAPKLEDFELSQEPPIDCFLENSETLVRVRITLRDPHHDNSADADHHFAIHGTALLAGISSARSLCLSAHRLKECILPIFNKLSRLELNLFNCYYWELLKKLLNRSPNLEHFVFELTKCECGESSDHQWSPPQSVPSCLFSQLKTISIRGFEGKVDQMDVAKYLLENGEVLKKMTIYYKDQLCKKEELHKEFSMFQWSSETCQVEILRDTRDTRVPDEEKVALLVLIIFASKRIIRTQY
ncbi:probable FBD-associated F-box protein At1g32375 [Argentina anserina]|uniref:probable FBD-associated F-box protein At1g32375 n=1 Tax=Argentina anserina TaxID=57926 RepID=UPI0021762912|nr:probable FBD-associated F-box protein At1g32375 [Potentilla anserina]